MKRIKVLIGKRRVMVIATLAILVLAAAALVASSASFTAQSTNLNNTFTAGTMTMGNDHAGAIMTVGPMFPGKSYTGTVKITNQSTSPALVNLKMTSFADPITGTLGAKLSNTLQLHIEDEVGTLVYDGALNAFPPAGKSCGPAFAANGFHTYTFTVSFPDSDLVTGIAGSDNEYQGCQTTCDFLWTAVNN
jgi:hypothetical protein